MTLHEALVVMAERARAVESAPGAVRCDDGTIEAPGDTAEMLLQGVNAPAGDVLSVLEKVAQVRGLPQDVFIVLLEVFVLGSLVGQS